MADTAEPAHGKPAQPERPERPAFTALVVYRNPEYRYSFLYPEGWHQSELDTEGGGGVIFSPLPDDVDTSFSVEARDIGMTVMEDDLPDLHAGLRDGAQELPGATILHDETYAIGALVGLELRVAYHEGETRRVRWIRLLYQGTTQVRMIAQGEEHEFAYWEPMLAQMLRTFRFGDWWAEITGQEWLLTLDPAANADETDRDRR